MAFKLKTNRRSQKYIPSVNAVLVSAVMLLLMNISSPQATSYESERPTTAQIEQLLKKAITDDKFYLPPAYKSADLLEFDLQKLEPLARSQWIVDADILFDFGPPPSGVLGFERLRRNSFRLILKEDQGQLRLKRFSPRGEVRALPKI